MIKGIWLPIVTPFSDDEVDFKSYKRLIDHYIDKGISGIIPLGTTGEVPTISHYEYEEIIEKTMEYIKGRVPVYVGLGGNNTFKVLNQLKIVERYDIEGILSVSPYYNRPSQKGIYEHYLRISEATDLDIIIYNIPYRTGRNIENETLYRLAELENVVGLKDACGDINQTMSLLMNPPDNFSILTGEDMFFYLTLTLGGHGGILASSHLYTKDFIDVYKKAQENDFKAAFDKWQDLAKFIPLLFEEPNPSPIKYCLNRLGLIDSEETRLPLMTISEELADKLEKFL